MPKTKGPQGRTRKVTESTLGGIQALHNNGVSVIKIAQAFDLSVATIRRAIKANFVYKLYVDTTRQAFKTYAPKKGHIGYKKKLTNGVKIKSVIAEPKTSNLLSSLFGNLNTKESNEVSLSIGRILHGLSIVKEAMTELDKVKIK
tara:strand:- start:956 stop:1390 length:435 start_codon:yes stop_codon:yes gene_type:complete